MQGKTVLVTGGTGALGRSVVASALDHGARVAVTHVEDRELELLRHEIGSAAERVRAFKVDVTNEMQVSEAVKDLGGVDVLLHLVGGFTMGPVHEIDLEAFRSHHALNLGSAVVCCKHVLLGMRSRGYGRIVMVGSRAAVESGANLAAYASAKAGIVALTKAIAQENLDLDVTANCVLPSTIDTPANRKAMGGQNAHRWVEPKSLAEVIAFLGSPAAKDLRGAVVPVYGGA